MGYLPMEIILEWILPKLPAKSLIRFKCVSKSFLAEISSLKFIKQHHHNAISSNLNRLLILPSSDEGIYVYDLDSLHSPPSFCPYPEGTFSPLMSVVAICEGYLLVTKVDTQQTSDLILLNPSTRTCREICCKCVYNLSESVLYGMWHCVDEFNDEYKVVRFVNSFGREGCKLAVMVYNTTTNTWKVVESRTAADAFDDDETDIISVLVQSHLLHLLFYDLDDSGYNKGHLKRIGCFDMKAERWANDVQLPDVLRDGNGLDVSLETWYHLGELDNQLCITSHNVFESSLDMWVMKEYDVKKSWLKLVSVRASSDLGCSLLLGQKLYLPLAYHTGSPHMLLYMQEYDSCKLYRYDLRDKKAIEVEFPLPLDHRHRRDSLAYICKGSLLDFPSGLPVTQ